MADEPVRRSGRPTKGVHTKSLDVLDQTADAPKKRGKKAAAKKEEEEKIRCVCGADTSDEDWSDWIACENCQVWQHNVCMGVTSEPDDLENMTYHCEQCRPEDHKDLLNAMARGESIWEERRRVYEEAEEAEMEAQKAKKGKKGKAKKVNDIKADAANGKAKSPDVAAGGKKDSKDAVGRSASTKRKARDEPQEESKSKTRKVTTPKPEPVQEYTPPSDISATISDLKDDVRKGVAKFIHKNLQFAMKNAQRSGTYLRPNSELEKQATRLALEIERAAHDTSASQNAYKDQGRKLASNLKTNQDLCDRLLAKTLSPSSFAVMTVDEMASKELQGQIAEMKARSDKQSIIIADDGPRMRRTHKGDEVIEEDSAITTIEDIPKLRRRSMIDPNIDMGARSRENSEGNAELPMDIDDYRSHDDIRGNAGSSKLSVDTQASPPAVRKSSAQLSGFDLNSVFAKVNQSPTVPQQRKPSGTIRSQNEPVEHDADIDRMLQDGAESPPYSPKEFDPDPSIVWRGNLVMNTIAEFPCVARHVAGAELSKVGGDLMPWTDLIPDELKVAGRIEDEKANEYLCSLRYSGLTDVVVLGLTPTGEAANEQFTRLFKYFHSKNRFGVLGSKAFANVRDTYLVPVPAGKGNVPEFLLNLETNKLPEDRPEPLILVTLVIRQEVTQNPIPPFDGGGSPRNAQLSSAQAPVMSPLVSQGGFNSPNAPLPGQPKTSQEQAEAQRQQRVAAQQNGERIAREILGPLASALTVSFLMPQAWQMQPNEWNIIKEIFQQEPNSQEDLNFLSNLLEKRNAPANQPK